MIDDTERITIRTLYERGVVSFCDLAEQIHLSPNATAGRVRRLVEKARHKGLSHRCRSSASGTFR